MASFGAMDKLADEDIWIGGMFALQSKDAIEKANITHVCSVLRVDLKESLFEGFAGHHVVAVDDAGDEDLLQHFPHTNAFISHGVSRGVVFVHCAMGISRSATVLTAYLMKSRNLSAAAALDLIKAVRPYVSPNDSFREQLALYEEMGCPDSVEEHPKYQRWLFRKDLEMSNAVGRAPNQIRFCDQEKEVAQVQGLEEGSSEKVELELRCKRCRLCLATSHALAPHKAKLSSMDGNQVCAHHFLEPLLWMKPEMSKGTVSGKLECPKCNSKVGSYAWQGIQCSCGGWVVPGISIARGKVDMVIK